MTEDQTFDGGKDWAARAVESERANSQERVFTELVMRNTKARAQAQAAAEMRELHADALKEDLDRDIARFGELRRELEQERADLKREMTNAVLEDWIVENGLDRRRDVRREEDRRATADLIAACRRKGLL